MTEGSQPPNDQGKTSPGVLDFLDGTSPRRKAAAVAQHLREISPQATRPFFISLGGASGAEIEQNIRNHPKSAGGVLIEFDDDLASAARETAAKLERDGLPSFEVLTGDILQKLSVALDRAKAAVAGQRTDVIVVSAFAVIHELPNRGSQLPESRLVSDLLSPIYRLSEFADLLFICREPSFPDDLKDKQIVLSSNHGRSKIEEIARRIQQRHPTKFTQAVPNIIDSGVLMDGRLACETLWKLFYSDAFDYEVDERITSFSSATLQRAIEAAFGVKNVRTEALQTESMNSYWVKHGIVWRSIDTDHVLADLPKPRIHTGVVAIVKKKT